MNIKLNFPLQMPGGTIDVVRLDLDRPRHFGRVDDSTSEIARIVGLPPHVLTELAESDYVKILITIEAMNAPRLAMRVVN